MESYEEMKKRHAEEVAAFPMKFPMDDVQFVEMMHEWHLPLNKSGIRKLMKVNDGAYIRKKDSRALEAMAARHTYEIRKGVLEGEEKERLKFALDAFTDMAETLGEDIDSIVERIGIENEVREDEALKKAYARACNSQKGETE